MLSSKGVQYLFYTYFSEPIKAEEFSKFSLKTIEQINTSPLKIILKKPDQGTQIPQLIFHDLFV